MTISMTQAFQANLENTGKEIVQRVGQWLGHLWTHIQNFPLYAQDPRVAYSSLIVVNVVAFQIATMTTRGFNYFVPATDENRSEICQTAVDLATLMVGYSACMGIVALFVKKMRLPLPLFVTIGISVATIAACLFYTSYRS